MFSWKPSPHRATAAVLFFGLLWFIGACTSESATQPPDATLQPPTSVPPTPTPAPSTPAPDPEATPYPNAVLGLVGGPASQSEADAQRDGVLSEVALLSFADRVLILDEVDINGQRWVLSRFPVATRPVLPSLGPWSHTIDPGSSELLHLDGNTIIQSVPMVGSPATWITLVDTTIYAGRVGDGGYPDSTLVRVDTENGGLDRLRLPWSYEREQVSFPSYHWDMVAPSRVGTLQELIKPIASADASIDAVNALDQAIDDVVLFDPYEMPQLGLSRSGCDIGDAVRVFDFGTQCIIEEGSRVTGDTAVVIAGERLPGMLVGAGWMSPTGPTYAAIVASPSQIDGEESSPLLFVDIHDPSVVLNTGVVGRGIISEVAQVDFFDGGFVTTTSVDLGVQVQGYNSRLEPLPIFASPTDADLGYPPDPFTTHAAIAPDGQRLATAQRAWPTSAQGLPGEQLSIVVTDTNNGDELHRVELELERTEYVRWLDFDGRWAVVSFTSIASQDNNPPAPARAPVVIDTQNGEIYGQGFEARPIETLERTSAPNEPSLRIMTPGPYRHGQTVTLRAIPAPLRFHHGERQVDWIQTVRLCASLAPNAECADLPVSRRTNALEIPIEIDVTLTAILGHTTTGDVHSDTTYGCVLGGCVLADMAIEFVDEAAPMKPTVTVDIQDTLATVDIESALFPQADVGICFLRGSRSAQQHRDTTLRLPFCTDFAEVDFVAGAAWVELVMTPNMVQACEVGECATQVFYTDR